MHFSFLLFTQGICQRSLLSPNKRLTMVRPKSCSRTNSKCDRVGFFYIDHKNGCQWCHHYATESKSKGNDIKLVVIVFYDSGYIENEKVSKTHYSYLAISNYRQLCVKFL